MLFLFRSAPEVEKRIQSKLFRKFWRSRGTKEPAYITVPELHQVSLSVRESRLDNDQTQSNNKFSRLKICDDHPMFMI